MRNETFVGGAPRLLAAGLLSYFGLSGVWAGGSWHGRPQHQHWAAETMLASLARPAEILNLYTNTASSSANQYALLKSHILALVLQVQVSKSKELV